MLKREYRELANILERSIKRYEVLLEKQYNVGQFLTRDEIQWMNDFNNPERQIHGIYYKLRRVDDSYVDMILRKFDSLKRKEHGLKLVQKARTGRLSDGAARPGEADLDEFFETQHKDTDRLVNDVILAIHKKSGGINPSKMEGYVSRIRSKIESIKANSSNKQVHVKAAINRVTNQIEIFVDEPNQES
jgi:hypothetical protein